MSFQNTGDGPDFKFFQLECETRVKDRRFHDLFTLNANTIEPMSQITKPFTHVAGTIAQAAQVNANDDTIYNNYNGNITDFNIHSLANINQSKILNLTTDLNVIRAERVTEVNLLFFQASGTYIKPSDLRFAKVIVIGGGGGGAGAIDYG